MYDLIIEIAHTVWRNGFGLTALGTAVFVLLKQRKVKKQLRKYIPWLLEDESETKQYVANQQIIIHNLKRLMERMGLEWDAPTSKQSTILAPGRKTSSIFLCSANSRAQGAAQREIQSYTKSNTRRRKNMKEYLKKLGSRKFQAFLAVTIPNMIIMFGFIFGDIDLEGTVNQWMPAINIVIQVIATAVYQMIEGKIDKANANKEQSPPEEDGSDYSH
ncbi:hypothetical protein ACX93W_26575 [Paenibacillus sp. CAU 1782]